MNLLNFDEFLIEQNMGLSQKSINKISDYLENDPNLADADVDEYIKLISQHAKLSMHSNKIDYKSYFTSHDMSEKAVIPFLNLFSKSDKLDELNNVIENKTTISDINTSGNFYNEFCKGWEKEAQIIAQWNDGALVQRSSAAVGKFEILLKFVLKDIISGCKGDVNLSSGEMEVKAILKKGGHPLGQGYNVKKPQEICSYIDKNLFGTENNTYYFAVRDKDAFKLFNENLVKSKVDKKDLAKCIVDAVCYQYNINPLSNLYGSAISYLSSLMTNKGVSSVYDIINLIGCIQLCIYASKEAFNYFFIVDVNSGNYVCLKDCLSSGSKLYDFSTIVSLIKFSSPSQGSSTERDWTVTMDLK